MKSDVYHFSVQVYYEDTDFSGVVYHANYLKYFERAREHVIGSDKLVWLWQEQGLGFAVYKANLTFADGVVFGDILDIRSSVEMDGKYRTIWHQEVWRPGGVKPAVTGEIHMVCLDINKQLKPTPVDFM